MNIRVLSTFPVEYVCHFPDPLVSHNLAAEEDGAATVEHGHVAPAVLVEIVPQHSASQLRSKHVITQKYRDMAIGIMSHLTATPSLGKAVRPPAVTSVR